MAINEGTITRVRLKRLRYGRYGLPGFMASCTREILELRSTPVPEDTGRGLRDRHWHRYSVFTDRREAVEMYGMSVSRHLGQQTVPAG